MEEESGQNYKKAPARALEHQLVLLLFGIVLHVEWLFKAKSGPDKGNFWLILTHGSVMSSFGGRRNYLKFSKAPARAPEHQLMLLDFINFIFSWWPFLTCILKRPYYVITMQ